MTDGTNDEPGWGAEPRGWQTPDSGSTPPPPPGPPPGGGYQPPPPGGGYQPSPPGYGPGPGYNQPPGYGAASYGVPPGYRALQGPPPSSNMVGAILATLFCCLPAGIVSIVYAAQVSSKWQAGDFNGAIAARANSRTWMWIAVGISVALAVLGFALGAFSDSSSTSNY